MNVQRADEVENVKTTSSRESEEVIRRLGEEHSAQLRKCIAEEGTKWETKLAEQRSSMQREFDEVRISCE